MKRLISVPLWWMIVITVLLFVDVVIIPYYQELRRDSAVKTIANPSTEEHDKLGQIFINHLERTLDQRQVERTAEHNELSVKLDTIIGLLNGTR